MLLILSQYPCKHYAVKVVFNGIGAGIMILICLYHLITSVKNVWCNKNKKKTTKKKEKVDAHYSFSIIAVTFATLTVISCFKYLIEKSSCHFILILGPGMYVVFKMMLYLTLIARLWAVFTGDSPIYKRKHLQLYSVIFVSLGIGFSIFTYIKIRFVHSAKNVYPYCLMIVPQPDWGSIALCLLDVVIGTINIILFSKPLCKMYSRQGRLHFLVVMYRACILAIIAHLTTIAALIAIFFGASLESMITCDCIISSLCVICMYHWNFYCTNWMVPHWREYKAKKNEKNMRIQQARNEEEEEKKHAGNNVELAESKTTKKTDTTQIASDTAEI